MIKAVIFDCFGVLTKDWWKEFCESLPPGEGLDKARALNRQYDAGLIGLKEFVAGVIAATGHEPQRVEDIFTNPEPTKNLELLDYIRVLKKTYKIGMISNIASNWVRESFLTADEQKLFDTMIFSFEAGAVKPEPKIYELALNRLGVEAAEAVFIDDQPAYCRGAEVLGMRSIYYRAFPQMKSELEKILS